MKKILTILCAIAVSSLFATEWASDYQSMSAFQKSAGRTPYVKPLATYVGTVLNGSWLSTASIEKRPSFEAGLPFNVAFISSEDRSYNYQGVKIPTIFGDKFDMGLGGNEDLHGLSIFTLPYLQLGGSFYYTRLVLRAMYFPSISELQGYHLFSFGLQHSFGHLFRDELPPIFQAFDVSLFFGYNSAYIGYTPDKWSGKMNLDFSTTYTALVFGFKPIDAVEFMLSLGYQTVSMEASGHLDAVSKDGIPEGPIDPDVSIDGRGGFRLGLEVAFSFGSSFHPVVGYNVGANTSLNANVLYFKQSFGEKEKPQSKQEKQEEPAENVQPESNMQTENVSESNDVNGNGYNSYNGYSEQETVQE